MGMLSSTKQYVNFVVQQGMSDAWPEHLGVSQESPGLPAHSEGQARQSVVVQSLHGHLEAGMEFLWIPSMHDGILCLLQ